MRAFILCFLLALPAAGVEPYLVKDIRPESTTEGSHPSHLVTFDGAVLFFVYSGSSGSGRELWRSDGTEAGTFPLLESDASVLPDPMPLAVTERLYLFVGATPGVGLSQLWVTDGTPAGTLLLTPEPGTLVSSTWRLWRPGEGVLYFTASDPEHGHELWRTDGTPAGTHIVADILPGAGGSGVHSLTAYRGRIWFGADDGERGGALWSSDGTAAGTVLAVDPLPSSSRHGSPEHIRAVGRRITFFAPPPGRGKGYQLWGGDGTARGTKPLTAISGNRGRITGEPPIVHDNRLYFLVAARNSHQLWVSDGTARGTRALLGGPGGGFTMSLPAEQPGLPGLFVFLALDRAHGLEPWVTDGTPQGTRLLRDICPGPCDSSPILGKMLGGRLYFNAFVPSLGAELWSTDGTSQGTRLVGDICPGECSSYPSQFYAVGGRLLFLARDGEAGVEIWSTDGTSIVRVSDFDSDTVFDEGFRGAVLGGLLLFRGGDAAHGSELWVTDGTPAGTRLVEDINQIDPGGSFPRSLMALGDEAVFVADDGSPEGAALWKSDGTAAGTVKFRTFGPDERDGTSPFEGGFVEAGGRVFYYGFDPIRGLLLWRTDGTAAGTFRLAEESAGDCCIQQVMVAVGDTVFVHLEDEEHGGELWASDGTREGTRMVRDIVPGPEGSTPDELTAFQGKLWFTVSPPFAGRELWTSDGTAAGTGRFLGFSGAGALTVHAGRLWFFAYDDHGQGGLWSTDGTEAGTRLEVGSLVGAFLFSLGDRLVITTNDEGIWVTDGTPAGTRRIHERGKDSISYRTVWTVFQGRLYYVATTGTLWVTDGTEAGTGPLLDRDGHEISAPGAFAVLDDRLVFSAPDRLGNIVLWESDGTPAGTFPVEPTVRLIFPSELVRAGDRVYFPSHDPATGWELWAVRP